MKASVDKNLCLGCGICPDICPEVFELDGGGFAVVKGDTVPPEAEDNCRDAAEQCPETAIKIEP
jgi:ferredoxin